MNEEHLRLCGGDEWASTLEEHIIPWVLDEVELGDEVIELGPGPGRTTEILRTLTARLIAVEADSELARALATRLSGSNVEVLHADATNLPLPDGRFTAALSFTMLHHVPSDVLQDKLFSEVARVVRPGGIFAGEDSVDSAEWRELHVGDVCVPVDPDGLAARLERAGFCDPSVDVNPFAFRFRATVPQR
jgi:SAM-dependent methyltransferase